MNDGRGDNGRYRAKYAADEPRQCPRCERFLEADNFYAHSRDSAGNIRTRQTRCKDCMRETQRERGGFKPRSKSSEAERKRKRRERYRAMMADPERVKRHRAKRAAQAQRRRMRAKVDPEVAETLREITRRSYLKLRANPEAWALRLGDQRIRYRGETDPRFRISSATGAYQGGAHVDSKVDAGPFLDYVISTFPNSTPEELEGKLGVPARRWREFFDAGRATVSLDLVDRAFTRGLGRPDLVAALYPYGESEAA